MLDIFLADLFAHYPECMNKAGMPTIVVRALPAKVHAELARRAKTAGQSLQWYLTAELTRIASSPTVDEVLRRIASRRGGRVGLRRAAADLRRSRGSG